jgi:hypothetical protein
MQKSREIVDVNLLAQELAKQGYEGQISFGHVTKWFPSIDGREPYGMIRTTYEIGFRSSYRYIPLRATVPMQLEEPKPGDYVFVLPSRTPQQEASKSTGRPHALLWGLVKDLPLTVLKSETLPDYIIRALSQWWWSRKTSTG